MNTAIIVAAGQGSRFAGAQPKQFLDLAGKPVISHTLQRFDECPMIDSVVVVLPRDGYEHWADIVASAGSLKLTSMVPGGDSRATSVKNGFAAVDKADLAVIAVHDGARPLVTSAEIASTVEKASETGAACLVSEVTDTIKEIAGELISGTIDRRRLRRALTPQCFSYDIFRDMLALELLGEDVTDECFLAEKLGVPVTWVEGNSRNIKITHPADLRLAEMLLRDAELVETA